MSDELFDDLQAFLDNGGEPAEPTPEERIAEAMRLFAESVAVAAKAIVDAITEAFQPFFEYMREWVRRSLELIQSFIVESRRNRLYVQLRGWHIPHFLAVILAAHWPEKWLPALALSPPELSIA